MKKLLVGLLALGTISCFAGEVCKEYVNSKSMNKICAQVEVSESSDSVLYVSMPKLIDENSIGWNIGKGSTPKVRARKICEALGIRTQMVLSYTVDHLGQEQANVNLRGNTFTSRFDAITKITCMK